jgi:trimethylamine monooxygenase
LRTANVLHPDNPCKGIFWLGNPSLMYLGKQDQYYTFTMFDAQAWYARDHVLGRISLPSREKMAADIAQWRSRLAEFAGPFDEIDFQAGYVMDLNKDADYPSYDVELTRSHICAGRTQSPPWR